MDGTWGIIAPIPKRRPNYRLEGYDYARVGVYFVTICVKDRRCALGEVQDGEIHLSDAGKLVAQTLQALPDKFPGVELDEWVVMPNHVHALIVLTQEGAAQLGAVIRAFKGGSTFAVRRLGEKTFAWQAQYHDRIVRNDRELQAIRAYIANNPLQWSLDEENPERVRAR